MFADSVRTLYDYNAWANERVLAAAAHLTSEQLMAAGGMGRGSVRDTLVHIMSAQWLYLSRWQGTSPRADLTADEFPDLPVIRTRWSAIERDTQEFVSRLRDDDLAQVVAYVNTRGKRWAYPLWQQMLHQVNHATQHRSEVAAMLTHFGHSPGNLDFLIYIDLQNTA